MSDNFFEENIWEIFLNYFQTFSAKISRFWSKQTDFTRFWNNFKTKSAKRKILVGRACRIFLFFISWPKDISICLQKAHHH